MFGRQPKENKTEENLPISEDLLAENTFIQNAEEVVTDIAENIQEKNSSEIEKISKIVSPYFIVVVGLSLYDKNFFLGVSLIIIGMFSLLKIKSEDLNKVFFWIRAFFN